MSVNIRNYRPSDFKTLLAIDQSCFPKGIAYTQFELKTYILRRGAFRLVAHPADEASDSKARRPESPQDSAILGVIVAESSLGIGHIITIDVRAAARRHRVG